MYLNKFYFYFIMFFCFVLFVCFFVVVVCLPNSKDCKGVYLKKI